MQDDRPQSSSTPAILDMVGKAALPATIACYVSGFLVASPLFTKSGVPLYAVPAHAYLAAGLLFLAISGVSILAGAQFGRVFRTTHATRKRLLNCLPVAALSLAAVTLAAPSLRALGYWLLLASPVAVMGTNEFALLDGPGLHRAWNWTRVGLIWMSSALLFSFLVYPTVQDEFGGGRGRVLFRGEHPARHPDPLDEHWFRIPCAAASPAPTCRTIRRVQETADYLYVSVHDQPGSCDSHPSRWSTWTVPTGACFARLPNKDLPLLLREDLQQR